MNDHAATPLLLRTFAVRPMAMEPKALLALMNDIDARASDALFDFDPEETEPLSPDYVVDGGVAIIPIVGVMLSNAPAWLSFFMDVADVDRIGMSIKAALVDPAVGAILLDVDCPGGSVDGVDGLASTVLAARNQKPVHVTISNMAASAGYWVPSQADEISAERTAAVGSIGVYLIRDDSSGLYEQKGVKRHLIRSGPYKGTGVAGVAITEQELEPAQEAVDGLCAIFVDAVASGRGMQPEAVGKLAVGRTWLAERAERLGLVDHVEGPDAALERVRAKIIGR